MIDRVAAAIGALCALFAIASVTPMPTWLLWQLRFGAKESTLIWGVLGLVAVAMAARDATSSKVAAFAVAGGLLGAAIGLAAFGLAVRAQLAEGVPFSPWQYLTFSTGADDAAVVVERDVVLDPSRPDLPVDVYRAPGDGPHPFVLVVHGGSWRHGDKGEIPHVSRALAAAGYTAIDVRYGLAPEHPFPQGIADVKCVLGRIREQAGRLGVDPDRAAVLGRSAGGHMALLVGLSAGDPRLAPACDVADRPVQRIVALYPLVDPVWGHDDPFVPDVIDGPESVELFLGGPPAARPDAYRLANPVTWLDDPGQAARPVPPVLLVAGAGERLVRPGHSRLMADALARHGDRVKYVEVPFAEHGFDVRPGGIGEQTARGLILDVLRGL